MARMEVAEAGARTRWRNPVLRFEGRCAAPADVVFELLADLSNHLEWAGRRQLETTRLLTLDAPSGTARVGTEFRTTGSDGKVARWSDLSVVTEAIGPYVFEFVTEGLRQEKSGAAPWHSTAVHRYEITAEPGGCRVVYTEDLTRLTGAPKLLLAPGVSRLLFRVSAKYMRRGFQGLLDLAAERAGIGMA